MSEPTPEETGEPSREHAPIPPFEGSREPLPAHRVALRAALCAPLAGFLGTLTALVLVLLIEGGPPSVGVLLGVVVLGTLGVSVYCGLLIVSEEVARRVPRTALRAPTIAAIGAGAALLAGAVCVWALAIYEGRGAEGALEEVSRLLHKLLRLPGETMQIVVITILPFVVVGGPRAVYDAARRPLWSMALAAFGGLLGAAGVFAFEGFPHRTKELVLILLMSVLGTGAGGLGLGLGERLEPLVLARWARWRDRSRYE